MRRFGWIVLLAAFAASGQQFGFTPPPGVSVQDEGTAQGRARTLNCVGAGITCSVSAGVGTLTVAGGAGSFTATEVAVDMRSAAPLPSFSATISDGTVTSTSKILVLQSGAAIGGSTVAFVNAAANSCVANTCATTISTTAGNDVIVSLSTDNTATVTSVTDTGGNAYSQRALFASSATALRTEIWLARNVTAATSVTANLTGVATNVVVSVAQYSGVSRFAQYATNSSGGTVGTTATASLTTQNSNNFVVAAFASVQGYSASVGNLRTQGGANPNLTGAISDNTSASSAAVANTVTLGGISNWTAVALELETSAKTSDENEMDALSCRATPAAGSFKLFCTSLSGMLVGRYKIIYTVG
jgi:hypothetical protein